MKAAIILFCSLFTLSCGSTGVKEYHSSTPKNSITTILYWYSRDNARIDQVLRIVKDTFSYDTINAETAKRIWHTDTSYFAPIYDSLGHPLIDTAKKQPYLRELRDADVLYDFNKPNSPL